MINLINNIHFKSQNPAYPAVTQPQADVNPNKNTNHTTRNILIGVGLTALAAAGIYIATRGKSGNSISKTTKINLADFKNQGKFNKGKAVLNSGENFSGTITLSNSGIDRELIFKDGILEESKDLTNKTSKKYIYSSDKALVEIKKGSDAIFKKKTENGIASVITNNGSYRKDVNNNRLLALGNEKGELIKSYNYTDNGELKSIRNYTNDTIEIYIPDKKTLDKVISTTKDYPTIIYDSFGTEIKRIKFDTSLETYDRNFSLKWRKADVVDENINLKGQNLTLESIIKQTKDSISRTINTENASLYTSKGDKKFGNLTLDKNKTIRYSLSKKDLLEIDNNKVVSVYNIKTKKFEKLGENQTEEELLEILKKAEQELNSIKAEYREGLKLQDEIKKEIKACPISENINV